MVATDWRCLPEPLIPMCLFFSPKCRFSSVQKFNGCYLLLLTFSTVPPGRASERIKKKMTSFYAHWFRLALDSTMYKWTVIVQFISAMFILFIIQKQLNSLLYHIVRVTDACWLVDGWHKSFRDQMPVDSRVCILQQMPPQTMWQGNSSCWVSFRLTSLLHSDFGSQQLGDFYDSWDFSNGYFTKGYPVNYCVA